MDPHLFPSPHTQPEFLIPAASAAEFLAPLGIHVAAVQDALLSAVDAASLRDDPFWANTARGIELWSTLVHNIREQLNEDEGWSVDNPHNRPVMIRDEGRYELALAGGDSATGRAELKPGLARRAGKATIESANRFSHGEFGALIPIKDLVTTTEAAKNPQYPYGTWILLYRCTKQAIYSEISVPAHISNDGEVDSWRLRVLFPVIDDLGNKVTNPLPDTLDDDLDFFIA